jgi:hypothetical protein
VYQKSSLRFFNKSFLTYQKKKRKEKKETKKRGGSQAKGRISSGERRRETKNQRGEDDKTISIILFIKSSRLQ